MTDPHDERKAIARAKLEHAGDMGRYLVMSRHKAAQVPPPEEAKLPPQLRTDRDNATPQYIR